MNALVFASSHRKAFFWYIFVSSLLCHTFGQLSGLSVLSGLEFVTRSLFTARIIRAAMSWGLSILCVTALCALCVCVCIHTILFSASFVRNALHNSAYKRILVIFFKHKEAKYTKKKKEPPKYLGEINSLHVFAKESHGTVWFSSSFLCLVVGSSRLDAFQNPNKWKNAIRSRQTNWLICHHPFCQPRNVSAHIRFAYSDNGVATSALVLRFLLLASFVSTCDLRRVFLCLRPCPCLFRRLRSGNHFIPSFVFPFCFLCRRIDVLAMHALAITPLRSFFFSCWSSVRLPVHVWLTFVTFASETSYFIVLALYSIPALSLQFSHVVIDYTTSNSREDTMRAPMLSRHYPFSPFSSTTSFSTTYHT